MPCDNKRPFGHTGRHWGVVLAAALLCTSCSWFSEPSSSTSRSPGPGATPAPKSSGARLGPPGEVRNWRHVRELAARRMVAASPGLSYSGSSPQVLLAIPVLTIELNADGSVRHIDVMRYPSQARDTVQLAIQAVRRAAPFGNVSRLPRPWKFNETFLFNEQRQFKPMTLDRR